MSTSSAERQKSKMRTLCGTILAAAVALATANAAYADEECPSAKKQPLKVLMIGNSFSFSNLWQMPQVAKAMGRKLDLASLFIGGCSLERHWSNVEAAVTNATFKPYRLDRIVDGRHVVENGEANIPDALAMDKWDVVTLQQASHFSWDPATYRPWCDNLLAKIRELAPQAEVVMQETWSYTPFVNRLAKWGFDNNEMYSRLHRAYCDYAGSHGLRVIPMGTAVQFWRERLPVKYSEKSFGGDVVGGGNKPPEEQFVQRNGKWVATADTIHLNGGGEYLQALVWTAALLDVDVTKCEYRPPSVSPEDAALMKRLAMDAVRATAISKTALGDGASAWGRSPDGEFWNGFSKRFMYAPAFGFAAVDGAARYRYEVIDDFHRRHEFVSDSPNASLDGVWNKLPVGYVTVGCIGENSDGVAIREAGRRTFWKKAAFSAGGYPPASRSFALARNKVYDYFMDLPSTRYLMEHGRPDPSYPLNGYPSKMLSAAIGAFAIRARSLGKGGEADAMVEAAKKAADFLIGESVPAGSPLANFTRTYAAEGSEYGRFKGEQDTIMLIYPARAGLAFLDLHSVSGDAKYLAAAERIGETYVRLQGGDGTWFLKQNAVTGKETAPNRLLPTDIVEFLESLYAATSNASFRAAADRAFAYIEKGPMVDWNWEGQFEDVKPAAERWSNLSKHPACSTAMYLLRRFPRDAGRIAQAEALVKFSEDQFVEWTPPYDHRRGADEPAGQDDGSWSFFCKPYSGWVTPCALEQYNCYYPIDASAAKMVNAYLALWRATGKREHLDKARALGATATRMQEDDGFICTWWMKGVSRNDSRYHTWINCLLATARALDNLALAEKETAKPL